MGVSDFSMDWTRSLQNLANPEVMSKAEPSIRQKMIKLMKMSTGLMLSSRNLTWLDWTNLSDQVEKSAEL